MTTNINIKTDAELKKQAEELFEELGMNMSTALNIFLRQAVRENRIPFEITRETLNARTLAALNDVKNGKNLSPIFTTIEDLKAALQTKD